MVVFYYYYHLYNCRHSFSFSSCFGHNCRTMTCQPMFEHFAWIKWKTAIYFHLWYFGAIKCPTFLYVCGFYYGSLKRWIRTYHHYILILSRIISTFYYVCVCNMSLLFRLSQVAVNRIGQSAITHASIHFIRTSMDDEHNNIHVYRWYCDVHAIIQDLILRHNRRLLFVVVSPASQQYYFNE